MQKPLVTVIIPVFNGSDYLQEAIESVFRQTYHPIELIVVNDGSDDHGKTERIALSYGDQIHYIRKENGGTASALNAGIRVMKGEYFSWLSHDDIFYPDKVSRQIELLTDKDICMSACSYNIFMDNGRSIPVPMLDFYGTEQMHKGVYPVINSIIQFGGVLMHRDIFKKYGMFREDLKTTQDYEFLFRVLRHEKCIYTNERLYGIRYHAGQGSNTIKSVDIDRDSMYLMFLEELTDTERIYMYGSIYNFYYQMFLRILPLPFMEKSRKTCFEGLLKNIDGASCCDTQAEMEEAVWIYGAGNYGRRLLFDLRCRGVEAAGFLDGNIGLRDTSIDGVRCFMLNDLETTIKDESILISSLYREEIAEQLRSHGIRRFLFKEEVDRRHFNFPPKKEQVLTVLRRYQEHGWEGIGSD